MHTTELANNGEELLTYSSKGISAIAVPNTPGITTARSESQSYQFFSSQCFKNTTVKGIIK